MQKRRNRIYRRIAVALTVALLAGQSHAFVLAEEDMGGVPTTEISDEKKTDVETGEDISGADADGDAENAGEGSEDITGDKTDPGTGTENGEEETPEEVLEENVSGNVDEIEEVEEPEEALTTAANGIETYAVNDRFSVNGITYRVDDDTKKEVSVYGAASEAELDRLEIPATVTNEEGEWTVTKIREYAFQDRQDLVSVKIADGITEIGDSAFPRCNQLKSVELPNSVKTIRPGAFADCKSLNNINIPNQLTYLGIDAFGGCSDLAIDIVIPGSLTEIGPRAFVNCPKLTNVTIPDSVTKIGYSAFEGCSNLSVLNIAVNTGGLIQLEDATVFKNCTPVRRIVFKNADGTAELTGTELENAKKAYLGVDDGDVNDGKWYGWWIDDPIVYAVNIEAYKDNQLWSDSGKEFVLRIENSSSPLSSYVTDLSMVEKGEYVVCETAEDGRKISTEVRVSVVDSAVSPRIDYYTVTFYDGETAYGDGTDQRTQIVVKNGKASRPSTNPSKNGFTFDKWVTDDKTTQFNFNSWITQPTGIYATWKESAVATYKVTINVKKDGDPWSDHGRTFALRKGNEPFITDLDHVENGTYDIFDIAGLDPDSYYSKARDTGTDVRVGDGDTEADVTVQNGDASAEVNYYTATFYDGVNNPYGTDTSQKPQIILNGKQVVRPAAPSKTGYTFNGWVTENGRSFDFDTQIGDTTDIYASWTEDVIDPGVKRYTINATAGAGGRIDPPGPQSVPEGGSKTFTIIPSEGYRIKSVMVDGVDLTEEIKEAGNSYTFTNVMKNCTINATFEADGSNPGGDGGNSGSGDGDHSDSGNGDHGNSGGGNGDAGNSGGGDNVGGDAGNSNGGDNAGGNSGSGNSDVSNISAGSAAAGGNAAAGSNSNGAVSGGSTGSKEPKTGDASQAEIYATIAMIAGLTYLILYFIEEGRGMSEREKDELVAAFIRWAKKGGAFRRCCAMVAIFCILAYYHSIGKRIGGNAINENYLGQLS